jgi:hypothetical protein
MEQDWTTRLYSLEDASIELGGISVWSLRKWIAQGSVEPVRLGRRVFLSSEAVARIRREGLPSLGTTGNKLRTPDASVNVEPTTEIPKLVATGRRL